MGFKTKALNKKGRSVNFGQNPLVIEVQHGAATTMCKENSMLRLIFLATVFPLLLLAGCKTSNPLQEINKTLESFAQPEETMEYMTDADEEYIIQAARKKETGKALIWTNTKTGMQYHLTLGAYEYGEGTQAFRPFTLYAIGELSRIERVDGIAASRAIGDWKVTANKAATTVTDPAARSRVLADLETAKAPKEATKTKAVTSLSPTLKPESTRNLKPKKASSVQVKKQEIPVLPPKKETKNVSSVIPPQEKPRKKTSSIHEYVKFRDELSGMCTTWRKMNHSEKYAFSVEYKNKPLPCETQKAKELFASNSIVFGVKHDTDTPRCTALRKEINEVIRIEESKTPEQKENDAAQQKLDEVFKL